MPTTTTTLSPATEVAPGVSAALRVACQLEQAAARVAQLQDLLELAAALGASHGVTPELRDLRRLTDRVEQLREPLNRLWGLQGDL